MRNVLRTILFGCLAVGFADVAVAGDVYYASSNLFMTKDKISAVNYRTGTTKVPVGAKVEVTDSNKKMVKGVIIDTGKSFTWVNHRSWRMKAEDCFEMFFSKDDPTSKVDALSASDKKLVAAAEIERGMSKAAVILSMGLPPPHKTKSLDAPTWIYWKSGNATFKVTFSGDDKVIAIDGWVDEPEPVAEPEPEEPKDYWYATANFHHTEGIVSWVNYQKGPIIPFNAKVEILDKGSSEVEFKVVETGKTYSFENDDDKSGYSTWELFQKFFSKNDQKSKLAELTKKERRRVLGAEIKRGMSKDAVRMAIGPPPPHKTPSLNSSTWTYWNGRVDTMSVKFDDDDKVQKIED